MKKTLTVKFSREIRKTMMNPLWRKTILHLLPKETLSTSMGWLSDRKPPKAVLQQAIQAFVKTYNIDTSELAEPIEFFENFDQFFTRKLKEGARVVDTADEAIASPADGTWAASGEMESLMLTQIKGKRYCAAELLQDEHLANRFEDGSFITIYLSPRDYHRVHFPVDGKVLSVRHIPGTLFPVNAFSTTSIENLFSRNERMIVEMETEHGAVSVVMVGATCVARITQSFDPNLPLFQREVTFKKSYDTPIEQEKGDELGVFHLGSTVVMLFEKNRFDFGIMREGLRVRMGERIATWRK